jgi:thiol-disulfide isomerase/thioredoxin
MKRLLLLTTVLFAFSLGADELAVGTKAPAFELTNAVNGDVVRFAPGDGKLSVVVFTCNQCPYAKAFEDRIVALGAEYTKKGVIFYAIDPNDDAAYPVEAAGEMKNRATAKHYPFPYLKDGDSHVARAFGARVTPHIFVIDKTGVIRYRGYVDDSAKPEERQHTGLKDALEALLAGNPVATASTRAFGCSIKFKPAA